MCAGLVGRVAESNSAIRQITNLRYGQSGRGHKSLFESQELLWLQDGSGSSNYPCASGVKTILIAAPPRRNSVVISRRVRDLRATHRFRRDNAVGICIEFSP